MLELLNVDRFDEMYGIMEYSFPESERRSREGQRKLFADPRYKVAAQSDESPVDDESCKSQTVPVLFITSGVLTLEDPSSAVAPDGTDMRNPLDLFTR